MMRKSVMMLSMLLMIVVLGACGGSEREKGVGTKGESNTNQSLTKEESTYSEDDSDDYTIDVEEAVGDDDRKSGNDLDDQRRTEPRQVPTQFPLPILEGWVEGSPFEELTTGKKQGWSAEYFYEDAIEANVKGYEQLLLEHGYRVEANAIVEMSLGKGFIVSGHISGIHYSGTVVFDTNAEGQHRVWMTFTEKKED